MKKGLFFLCILLPAVCTGSAFAEAAIFTGGASGLESVVTATITMDNGTMTAVELDVSGETPGIGDVTGGCVCPAGAGCPGRGNRWGIQRNGYV